MKVNPVARLLAALLLALCLLLSIDWVSASVSLLIELAIFIVLRMSLPTLMRATWPVWLAAATAGLMIVLYGQPDGRVYAEFLFARITDGSIELAIATTLRVLAIGLPAVMLMRSVDTTAFADGLAQRARLPDRFVIGALAGLRLVSVLAADWRSLELARRARGVADTRRASRTVGQGFALLVIAVRRGDRLATAMEARGFGAPTPRTRARESPWGWGEWAVSGSGLVVGGIAIAVSVLAGTWNPLV